MSDSSYLPPVRLEAHRERIVAELAEHFAHDHLDTAEFENRLDRAYRATTLAELDRLKSDLPAIRASTPDPPAGRSVGMARSEEVRDRQLVLAIMGASERKGVWTPARSLDVLAFMGGVGLDFREARFAPGVTQVNILALMGGVEIVVPPDLRVECSGFGIMGGFESLNQNHPDHDDTPLLKITGVAIMGGVEISQRLAGESTKQARLRRREERRRLRGDGTDRGARS